MWVLVASDLALDSPCSRVFSMRGLNRRRVLARAGHFGGSGKREAQEMTPTRKPSTVGSFEGEHFSELFFDEVGRGRAGRWSS